ncbi:MAG: hypothetical protein ACM3O3_05170 [Syntrophothermus sp.]
MEKLIITFSIMIALLYPILKLRIKLEEKNKIKDRINRYFKDDD